jgi:hypothetical protein
MLREFYKNPPTNFSEEVKSDYSFPETSQIREWEDRQRGKARTYVDLMKANPDFVASLAVAGFALKFMLDAFGPTGEAMKMIVNKNMSRSRYYAMRVIPFAAVSYIFYTARASSVNLSNPYSRGELK